MKIIMDSDCLIKLTKAEAKEVVVRHLDVYIPSSIKSETVDLGIKNNYPDALIIQENVLKGKLKVKKPKVKAIMFKGGEAEVYSLYIDGGFSGIASDDSKFLKKLETLKVNFLTPVSCIIYCHLNNGVSLKKTRELIENMKPYISVEEYSGAVLYLEGKT